MNLDQALQTYIVESREMLEAMETALLGLAHTEGEERGESINAIFRAAHTIKGSAGLFGLDQIVEFTHVVESVLDHVRDGKVAIEDALVTLLLSCGDHIGTLIDITESTRADPDESVAQAGKPLLVRLSVYLAAPPSPALPAATLVVEADPADFARMGHHGINTDNWHISLRFGRDVLRNGMDPLSFIRYLGTMGEIVGIVTLHDG